VLGTLSETAADTVASLLRRLSSALNECSDAKFTERVDVINNLLRVWAGGEEVELRCSESPPPQPITAQLSADDVQLLANSCNAPGLPLSCLFLVKLSEWSTSLQVHTVTFASLTLKPP